MLRANRLMAGRRLSSLTRKDLKTSRASPLMASELCADSGANRPNPSPNARADAMATCRSMKRSGRLSPSEGGALVLLVLVLHAALSVLVPVVLVVDDWLALQGLSAEVPPRHAAQAFTAP